MLFQVLACFLTQQRLVFLAHQPCLLTPLILAFLVLILPFRWALTLVPVLPRSLLEFLAAPGVFVMGVDAAFTAEVMDLLNDQGEDQENGMCLRHETF